MRVNGVRSSKRATLYEDDYFSQRIASRFWLLEAGRCLSEMLPSIDARNETDGQGGTD
jgi:hypothetical protein